MPARAIRTAVRTRLLAILFSAAAMACPASLPSQSPQALAETVQPANGTRIVLLGTAGGPIARLRRSQPATLIMVGGRNYLFDAGDGVVHQLVKAGVQPQKIDQVFLTHLHGDHVAGLASLMMFYWTGRNPNPMQIHGPPGTAQLVEGARAFVETPFDVFRQIYGTMPEAANHFPSREPKVGAGPEPTLVYEDDRVRVSAIENTHYIATPLQEHAYGKDRAYSYRIDTPQRSIVITGDTGASVNLSRLAAGADVLVTEVIDLKREAEVLKRYGLSSEQFELLMTHMRKQHISPEEIGRMAAKARVGMVVLTHIVPGEDSETDRSGYIDGIRKYFTGRIHFGRDLDRL